MDSGTSRPAGIALTCRRRCSACSERDAEDDEVMTLMLVDGWHRQTMSAGEAKGKKDGNVVQQCASPFSLCVGALGPCPLWLRRRGRRLVLSLPSLLLLSLSLLLSSLLPSSLLLSPCLRRFSPRPPLLLCLPARRIVQPFMTLARPCRLQRAGLDGQEVAALRHSQHQGLMAEVHRRYRALCETVQTHPMHTRLLPLGLMRHRHKKLVF
eukprot:SAG22_NODE_2933_length_2094_cov_35.050627_3_plen_210_part_00